MGLGRLCSSYCCNVHVLQISPSSETLMPAASQRKEMMQLLQWTLHSSPLRSSVLAAIFYFFFFPPRKLQSVHSLIELKSASQSAAQASEKSWSFSIFQTGRGLAGTHVFFFFFFFYRRYSVVIDKLQDHGNTLVFALLSGKQFWIPYSSPVEVNEGLFSLQALMLLPS